MTTSSHITQLSNSFNTKILSSFSVMLEMILFAMSDWFILTYVRWICSVNSKVILSWPEPKWYVYDPGLYQIIWWGNLLIRIIHLGSLLSRKWQFRFKRLLFLIIYPDLPVLICPETTGINFIKEIALRYKRPQSAWRRWRSKKDLNWNRFRSGQVYFI